ncbi:36485_t:CDS:2 [Racocetra persica]|uniref:36485_t:CDS:1 n=1 Tax=Racocetra persica TaxID=160502 RepID=A0ACA9Q3K8_9GLOM|nr:36485_t:CDS:2 [Racocetra persica]
MDSEDDFATSLDTLDETIDSDEVATSSSVIDTQIDSENEFITPASTFDVIESYPNEDTDMSSKKRRVDLTDFFNKVSISPEKTDELHTLLLNH